VKPDQWRWRICSDWKGKDGTYDGEMEQMENMEKNEVKSIMMKLISKHEQTNIY